MSETLPCGRTPNGVRYDAACEASVGNPCGYARCPHRARRATIIPPVFAESLADVARIASRLCDEHEELVKEALSDVAVTQPFAMPLARARERLSTAIEKVVDAIPEDDHARRSLWLHRSRLTMLGIVVADPWAMELLAMANEAEPRSTLPAPAPTEEM